MNMQVMTKDELSLSKSFYIKVPAKSPEAVPPESERTQDQSAQVSITREISKISGDIRVLIKDLQKGRISQDEFSERLSEYANKYIREDMPVDKKSKIISSIRIMAKFVNNYEAQEKFKEGAGESGISAEHKYAQGKINEWADRYASSRGVRLDSSKTMDFNWTQLKRDDSLGPSGRYPKGGVKKGLMVDMLL